MNKKISIYSLYFKCRESYAILKDFISFLKNFTRLFFQIIAKP